MTGGSLGVCGKMCLAAGVIGFGAVPPALGQARVAMLEIQGAPTERAAAAALFGGMESGPETLRDYVGLLHSAAENRDLDGVILRLKDAALSLSQVEELSSAIDVVQASGKQVHTFAEGYGPIELALAAGTDHVMVQHGGVVSLPGLYMEEMYLADMFDWVGLKPQMVQVGDYKGANEQYMNSEPSKAWDQNIEGLLDGMYTNLRSHLKKGRGLNDRQLDRAMENAWMAGASSAIDAGLIDAEVDLGDLTEHLEKTLGTEISWAPTLSDGGDAAADMMAANPLMAFSEMFATPERRTTGPTIAVLHLDGAIVDGDSQPAGFMSGASVGSRTLRNAMRDIAKDENIEGLVVRIDSPGGSAIASEVMWYGLRELAEEKPVWVSVGSMAASGGYYVAVGGEKIYVNPTSIVGSIGVVGGKISMGELFDRLEINVVERARGPRADLFSTTSAWDKEQVGYIRDMMTETYEQFTDRVTQGREGIDLGKVAEGRLFVGSEAIELGMADEIGGLDDAIADLAAELDLDEFEVMSFPAPQSFEEVIEGLFGQFLTAPDGVAAKVGAGGVASLLREALGAERFEALRDQIGAFSLLRDEPVLLTMPKAIRVK